MHRHSGMRLRLRAQPQSARLLRQRLSLWLDELGARGEEIFDLSLASTEAFVNAVEHPHEPTAEVIEVEGNLDGRTITITVRDHGSWRLHRQQAERGYGLPLMRQLMNIVEVHRQPEGTAITMQRQLARPRRFR